MDASFRQLAAREELIAAMQTMTNAKSTCHIAAELGCQPRDVLVYKSIAGVRPAYHLDGAAYYAPADVEAIKAAAARHGPLKWKSCEGADVDDPPSPVAQEIDRLCGEIMAGARAGHLDPISERIVEFEIDLEGGQ
jgi:hypothetical protein